MAQILIRGLDEKVVARLKSRANSNGRSLEGEARSILQSAAGYSPAEARKALRALRKSLGHKFSDSSELIAEDRLR